MRIVVGLYQFNTQALQHRSLATRLNLIEDAIAEFKNYVDGQQLGNQPFQAVFLAPEYMFSRAISALARDPSGAFHAIDFDKDRVGEHVFGERRQMEEEETQKLQLTLERLSRNFPNALLVPGSAAWRQKIPAKGTAERGYEVVRNAQDIIDTVNISVGPPEWPTRMPPSQWPVFPKANNKTPDKKVHTPRDKLDELVHADYVARNTAFCYFNGNCLFKYNKIGDFHEVFHERKSGPDTVHIPGVQPGRFDLPGTGVKVGISICYDQSLSVFGKPLGPIPLQFTAEPVNLHILLSACIAPQLGFANLSLGGYLLSCSSQDCFNKVLKQGGTEVPPQISQLSNLKTFFIEL